MKFVVDTNIFFSFFWKNSLLKQILVSPKMKIFSPEFSLYELKKYSFLIIKKTKISRKEFNSQLNNLKCHAKFLPESNYKKFIKLAKEISPEKDDAHFLALSLKLDIPLWSNDRELKKQDKVTVLNTEEVIDIFS